MAKPIRFEDLAEGREIPSIEKAPITKVQLLQYAGASHDYNLLHTDDEFARKAGMPHGVIAHGMLSMAFAAQLLTDWVGLGRVRRVSVRFTAPTEPGDVVTAGGKVIKKFQEAGENRLEFEIWTRTQKGTVTTKGVGVVAPAGVERARSEIASATAGSWRSWRASSRPTWPTRGSTRPTAGGRSPSRRSSPSWTTGGRACCSR
jgi:acyl dehydratase